eukprot:1341042-Prymnesium_polylepis.1
MFRGPRAHLAALPRTYAGTCSRALAAHAVRPRAPTRARPCARRQRARVHAPRAKRWDLRSV